MGIKQMPLHHNEHVSDEQTFALACRLAWHRRTLVRWLRSRFTVTSKPTVYSFSFRIVLSPKTRFHTGNTTEDHNIS